MLVTDRARIAGIVARIDPYDDIESAHQRQVLQWIESGAPLYRIHKPDDPPQHLVAYFVVTSPTGEILLVDHLSAGRRIPTGGHCEPGELPWQTVQRECQEELGIAAGETTWLGQRPLFVTVTKTRDPHGTLGTHHDVSLWHVSESAGSDIVEFDRREFSAVHWMTPQQILDTAITELDPHMHRFTRKFLSAQLESQGAR